MHPKLKLNERQRNIFYQQGALLYHDGTPEPYPDSEYQSEEYYVNAGWRYAFQKTVDAKRQEEQEEGLDYESLDKLANQLKVLGFTIPNEEK